MDYDQNWKITIHESFYIFFIYLNVLSKFHLTATTATTAATVTATTTAAAVNQLMLFNEWVMH